MMSKAEERALEAYPYNRAYTNNDVEYDGNFCNRLPYIEGYEQAEKDLELTWEDIEKITNIWDDLHEDEAVYSKTGCDTPEFYQEILKRFKERKEK